MSRYQNGRYYGAHGTPSASATSPLRRFVARTSSTPRVTGTTAQAATHVAGPRRPDRQPPAASFGSVLPPDPVYDQQVAALTRRRDDTISALGTQRHNTLLDYGYTASSDPAGNVTGLQFDPSNPYSQAALMLRNYKQRQAGTTTSMAASGQLYSGALQTAQENATSGYNATSDHMQRALLAFLARNQSQQSQAGTDYETDAGLAAGERVTRAPQNPLYDKSTAATPRPRRPRKKGPHHG